MPHATHRRAARITLLATALTVACTAATAQTPHVFIRPPVAPPPGTLGVTYRQPSWLVPKDAHPRTAMIDVIAPPGAQAVAVEGLEDVRGSLGEDGIWHFTSQEPLMPHLSHIYVVRARITLDGKPTDVLRTVRLIPGRLVLLTY